MGYNWTVTRIWGIPIRINVSLVVFLPVLTWLIASGGQIEAYAEAIELLTGQPLLVEQLRAGVTPWVIGVVASLALFTSVTLHELGHSWVALRYDIEIDSITLWILGGLASLRSVPRESNREFWIAVAGPLVSLGLAALGWGVIRVLPSSLTVGRFLVGWVALTNLTLAVFNLLPAFPMDGGRILRAYLSRSRSYAAATQLAARIGVAFAVVFVLIGVVGGQLTLLLLAVFIYTAATGESRSVMLGDLLEGFTVGDLATRDLSRLSADTTVAAASDRLLREPRPVVLVADETGVVGVLTLGHLQRVDDPGATTLRAVAEQVPRFDAATPAFTCLTELGGADTALVTADDRVVGVVTREDFGRTIALVRGRDTDPTIRVSHDP